MDSKLRDAAREGNVDYLIEQIELGQPVDFFLAKNSENGYSIFHIAVIRDHQPFIKSALIRLPAKRLICQTADSTDENALHAAARGGNLEITSFLVDAYNDERSKVEEDDAKSSFPPPWRARNKRGYLPVHLAAESGYEQVAKYLLALEKSDDFFGSLDNNDVGGSSLFVCATRGRCKHIVKEIWSLDELGVPFSIRGITLFDLRSVVMHWSERDALRLLQNRKQLTGLRTEHSKQTIIHMATKDNLVEIVKWWVDYVDCKETFTVGKNDQNPMHIAVERGHLGIMKILLNTFNTSSSSQGMMRPWRQQDRNGNTPLHLALKSNQRDIATTLLELDVVFLSNVVNNNKESPLSVAVEKKFGTVVWYILNSYVDQKGPGFHPRIFLQILKDTRLSGDDYIKTRAWIQQHPEIIGATDETRKTILDIALDENNVELMRFILENIDPDAFESLDTYEHRQEPILIRACRNSNMEAIRVICKNQPSAASHLHYLDESTALHNVRLKTIGEYRLLLSFEEIADIRNIPDALGRTPLMRAIQDDDIHLAEALLELNTIDLVKAKSNYERNTAAKMLKDKSGSKDWEHLYLKAIFATFKISKGQNFETALTDLRNALLIVAALLATITFAAAFTVPGGFNQTSGKAVLGEKACFLAFVMSDTYAMCCSMLVIFSLTWTTFQEPDRALAIFWLVITLLYQALYGTLVAFMTGVCGIMPSKSIWATIGVLVLPSSVLITTIIIANSELLDEYIERKIKGGVWYCSDN